MDQMKCDARGSARVFKAAFMLFTNPNMTVDDAMKAAEFTKREISRRAVRQSISKKKNRLLQASARRSNQSTLPPVQNITVWESSAANVSSLSNESSEATMLDDNPPEIRVMDNERWWWRESWSICEEIGFSTKD